MENKVMLTKGKEEITTLNYNVIMGFIERNEINIQEIINIEIVIYQDDNFSGKNTVKDCRFK